MTAGAGRGPRCWSPPFLVARIGGDQRLPVIGSNRSAPSVGTPTIGSMRGDQRLGLVVVAWTGAASVCLWSVPARGDQRLGLVVVAWTGVTRDRSSLSPAVGPRGCVEAAIGSCHELVIRQSSGVHEEVRS